MRGIIGRLLGRSSLALVLMPAGAPASQSAAVPCSEAQYRQFDFWAGEWEVRARGELAGHNRIEPILGGCALLEHWEGTGGSRGKSLNSYSAGDGRWHQSWIDARGGRLELAGGWDEGKQTMTLSGTVPERGGEPVLHEISWERRPDGTVRQRWRASRDQGATWSELFDGIYTRKK